MGGIDMSTKLIHVKSELVSKLRIAAAINNISMQQAANEALIKYIQASGGDKYETTTL